MAAQDEALVDDLVDDLIPLESGVAEALGGGDDRLVRSEAGDVFPRQARQASCQ